MSPKKGDMEFKKSISLSPMGGDDVLLGSAHGGGTIENDVVGMKLLSLAQIKEIDEFLQRKLGTFDGERIDTWSRFVGLYESVCESRGWNGLSQETLVELLTGLLVGKAQTAWYEWSRDEPDMMVNYNRLKNELPHKLICGSRYPISIT